jgi:hypothetical protein
MRNLNVTTLEQIVKTARQRQAALQPFDLTDQVTMYQYRWPQDLAPVMDRLTRDRSLILSPRAETQLLQRCQIPAPFFRRLPENLKWAVVNWAVQSGSFERAALLRTVRGNVVRAMLTEAYCSLDDVPVMEMLSDIISDQNVRIEALSFEDDFTHVRILFPQQMIEVKKNDIVMTGINLSNSETGCRAVHVDALVYRLVCTNGLVRAESSGRTTIRHIGQHDRLKDAMAIAIRDAKENAFELARQFKDAVTHTISDPEELLKNFAKDTDMTREQLQAALSAFAIEPDRTAFGVTNAVTRAAQAEESFEGRYQMERLGANLLSRLS